MHFNLLKIKIWRKNPKQAKFNYSIAFKYQYQLIYSAVHWINLPLQKNIATELELETVKSKAPPQAVASEEEAGYDDNNVIVVRRQQIQGGRYIGN